MENILLIGDRRKRTHQLRNRLFYITHDNKFLEIRNNLQKLTVKDQPIQ